MCIRDRISSVPAPDEVWAAVRPHFDAEFSVVFVLGGPGSGKGTQCARIVERYGHVHLSAGDLLRAERESGSEQGEMIQGYITEGKIVPVEVTIKLIMKAIEENGGKRFLIDGFPRNTNNLSGWQQVAGDAITLAGVLCYDVSEEVLLSLIHI